MKKLLIADDDAGMRVALETRFQRLGWKVDVAMDGAQALEKFRAGSHALIITDVRMPERDGFSLMREVQAVSATSSVRTAVILLTAYGCIPDAVEAMRDGACDYGKIGDWIEKLGFASEQDVTTALALQWGCPVALSFDPTGVRLANWIPLPILEAFQMLPTNYATSTNMLYMAFGERVDHAALYAIEKVLGCRTQPCVAERKGIARQLDSMRQSARPRDVEFGPMNNLGEMARIALSYTTRLSPDSVRLSRIGRFIWLRLERRTRASTSAAKPVIRGLNEQFSGHTNIVFRLSAEAPPTLPFVLPLSTLPIENSSPVI